jgi:hypothetical protein
MSSDTAKTGFFLFVVIAAIVFSIIVPFTTQADVQNVNVTNTEIKRVGETDKYLVNVLYDNGTSETFIVADNWLLGHFSSSDTYFKLKNSIGTKVSFRVYGWRVPILSWWRTIYKVY